MKVILNVDVDHLGEEGDVKNVANGYMRNYLYPRRLALPYNAETAAIFEGKREEIEARKAVKRQNSRSLKEKLESAKIEIVMGASDGGKLYGAVNALILQETLASQGLDVERKKIDLHGASIKTVGTYKASIKLYEDETAEVTFVVKAQQDEASKKETKNKKEEHSDKKANDETESKEEAK